MHETLHVDQRMLSMVINLEKGSLISMILAETLNGLDAIHRRETTFFVGSLLLFQV